MVKWKKIGLIAVAAGVLAGNPGYSAAEEMDQIKKLMDELKKLGFNGEIDDGSIVNKPYQKKSSVNKYYKNPFNPLIGKRVRQLHSMTQKLFFSPDHPRIGIAEITFVTGRGRTSNLHKVDLKSGYIPYGSVGMGTNTIKGLAYIGGTYTVKNLEVGTYFIVRDTSGNKTKGAAIKAAIGKDMILGFAGYKTTGVISANRPDQTVYEFSAVVPYKGINLTADAIWNKDASSTSDKIFLVGANAKY